jgi:hypothetical protein
MKTHYLCPMKFLLPISIFILLFSCSSGNSEKPVQDSTPEQKVVLPQLKKGEITDLSVVGDPGNSYSVYLPTNYDSTKRYPVIIFFDAHANGHLPLNNYKSLAEKWGYIFVGSNSSKNGLDMEVTQKIGVELIDEVEAILPIDLDEILLCGFSGGSRVAAYLTQGRPDVKGVICNSAAPQAPLEGKVFVGLAGLGDMNYLEMKKFCDGQPTNKFPHDLLVFDGKHEWAPLKMMEDAMLIAATYHAPGIKPTSSSSQMLDTLEKSILSQADSLKKTSCMLARNILQVGANACLTNITSDTLKKRDPRKVELELMNFSKNPCVKSDEAEWKKAETEESTLQQEIGSAIMQQDTTWWKNNAARYFETTKTGAEKFMRQRLRGYASLMCYSYINQANQVNNLHAAEKLIIVYSIVDPTNSEWAYMQATLYMKINLPDYALASLNKAVEIGFNDLSRMQNDPAFLPLQSDARFSEVLGKIK